MDAGLAALGHGWPFAAGPPNQCRITGMPSLSEGPSGGARAFCLLLGCSKVRRRKGATVSSRDRSNGYVHKKIITMPQQDHPTKAHPHPFLPPLSRLSLPVSGLATAGHRPSERNVPDIRASRSLNSPATGVRPTAPHAANVRHSRPPFSHVLYAPATFCPPGQVFPLRSASE